MKPTAYGTWAPVPDLTLSTLDVRDDLRGSCLLPRDRFHLHSLLSTSAVAGQWFIHCQFLRARRDQHRVQRAPLRCFAVLNGAGCSYMNGSNYRDNHKLIGGCVTAVEFPSTSQVKDVNTEQV